MSEENKEPVQKIRVELFGVRIDPFYIETAFLERSFDVEDTTCVSFMCQCSDLHVANEHLSYVDEEDNLVMVPYCKWSKAEIIVTDISEEEKETV